ncbi:MAG: LysR family transcriptional regulator [Myxococcota bacterium]|nr:LysR family transcriptional regulator [Myxococcota bacterium]
MDVLSGMQAFVKVVDEGSFTKAARSLGMPKSTLSRHVAALEDRLGVRLLHRTTRSLRPTDVGMAYYDRCTQIVEDVAEAESAVTQLHTNPRGVLKISAPVSFGHLFLPGLIRGFMEHYPEVEIELSLSDRYVDLVDEGVDVALRAGVLEDSSLIARRLGSATRACVASPEYLEANGTPTEPGDLRDHACLGFGLGRQALTWAFDHERIHVNGPLVANSPDVVMEAARAHMGIAFLPRHMVAVPLEKGELVSILQDHLADRGGVYVVYSHSRHLSAKVRAFVTHCIDHLGPVAPWDQPVCLGETCKKDD